MHFFIGGCDWYIAEYDGNNLFYGYAILNGDQQNSEWGYISFSGLKSINISTVTGLRIEACFDENDYEKGKKKEG